MANKFKLVCLRNNDEFIIDSPSMLAGRSTSCEIRVEQGNASREHARVTEQDDGLMIQDLHSTNGTFVNNKRITAATLLVPGSIVKFGEESFSLQLIDNEATIVAIPVNLGNKRVESSFVDDEDDEEDSTVMFQAYQLPPGWTDLESDNSDLGSPDDERKTKAIAAYVAKASAAMKGRTGILMFFFIEEEPPSIRSLSIREEGDQQWSFGRNETSDVSFKHQSVSENHAILKYSKSNWVFEDNQSTNGIWFNKERKKSVALKDDMRIYVGTVEILVRLINT